MLKLENGKISMFVDSSNIFRRFRFFLGSIPVIVYGSNLLQNYRHRFDDELDVH